MQKVFHGCVLELLRIARFIYVSQRFVGFSKVRKGKWISVKCPSVGCIIYPLLKLFLVSTLSCTSTCLPSPSLGQRILWFSPDPARKGPSVREIMSCHLLSVLIWGSFSGFRFSLPLFPSTRVINERLLLNGRQYLQWIMPTHWMASFSHKMDAASQVRKQFCPFLRIASGSGALK